MNIVKAHNAMTEFCRRVEAGEIRSVRSYAAFKEALTARPDATPDVDKFVAEWEADHDLSALEREALATMIRAYLEKRQPVGYIHVLQEPGQYRIPHRLFTSTPDDPWKHWKADYRAECIYELIPLYA